MIKIKINNKYLQLCYVSNYIWRWFLNQDKIVKEQILKSYKNCLLPSIKYGLNLKLIYIFMRMTKYINILITNQKYVFYLCNTNVISINNIVNYIVYIKINYFPTWD